MFPRNFFDDIPDFRRAFERVFENMYNPNVGGRQGTSGETTFAPPVEIWWTDDYLNLRVVVPGVKDSDIKVSAQGNQLVIQGERKLPEELKEGNVYRQLPYGRFERVLDLPNGLDLDKLQAQLHEGVLDIRIPVAQAMKPKQIQIQTGEGETRKPIAA
jgi:HSP20 family protein